MVFLVVLSWHLALPALTLGALIDEGLFTLLWHARAPVKMNITARALPTTILGALLIGYACTSVIRAADLFFPALREVHYTGGG